jgi:hypothetical protein
MATHNMFAKTLASNRVDDEGKITQIARQRKIQQARGLVSFAAVGNTYKGNASATSEGTTMVDVGTA